MKKFFSTITLAIILFNSVFFSFPNGVSAVETDGNASNWTYEKARHLASKVLFSAREDIVNQLFQAGSADAAVDILFPSEDGPDRTSFNQTLSGTNLYDANSFENGTSDMYKYYMYKKYLDPYEAKAKLFLIFEDTFSVDFYNNRIEYSDIEKTHDVIYNDIFGDGGYKKMLKDIVFGTNGSYSLGEYLDFFNLNKKYPNENYSRELMQLFMMGIFKPYDNQNTENLVLNYSEDDVASIAKILTGFRFNEDTHEVYLDLEDSKYGHNRTGNGDLDGDGVTGDVFFLDGDLKSGDSFSFYNSGSGTLNLPAMEEIIDGNNGLPDNTLDYIFSKRGHEIALFLADKFFRFYANMQPTKDDLENLASIFIANDFKIYPTIKTFLKSDVIYSDKSMNSIQYKNPIELGLGTMKLINQDPAIGDLDYLGHNFLTDLGWKPYGPVTIFGRDGFDDNSAFYDAYIHDKWMTYSTKIFYNNSGFDLKNFVTDQKINETGSIIFSTSTGNTFSGEINLDEISLNLTGAVVGSGGVITENKFCTGSTKFSPGNFIFPDLKISTNSGGILGEILIGTGSINISENFLEISTGSLIYSGSTCKILSGTGNISNGATLTRDFTVEEFFSDFEEKIYIGKKIPEEVKNSLKKFLTTDENGEKISFDVTDENFRTKKIIPAISILLSQPEFVMVSGFDKEKISEGSGNSPFEGKKEKLVIVNLGGGYDWLNGIIPKAEYNTTYQDFRKKTDGSGNIIADIRIGTGDLIDLEGTNFYLNKNFQSFKDLYDDGNLRIFNRIGISNQSRGHDVATIQLTGSDGKAIYGESEGLIGRLSKYEENALKNISIGLKPYIYRGGKSVAIGGSGLKIFPYGAYSGEQRDDIISSFSGVIASRSYPGNSSNIFIGSLDLHKVGDIAKNSELNRDGAGYGFSDNLDFLKIAIENGVGSTFFIKGPGGYDTHSNQLKISDKYPEGYLNSRSKEIADNLKDFFNSIKGTQDVTIVVQSEFGRTNKVNGSNGTDHGKGGGYFVITNNQKLKNDFPKNIYGKMNLEKEKDNWLSVGIDFRSIYQKILQSLYGVSDSYFGGIYNFEDYIDENPPKVNYLRPELKKYNNYSANVNLKFSVDDKNFKLYDGSNVKLYHGWDPENLKKFSHWTYNYIKKSQWETETTYVDGDSFTLDYNLSATTFGKPEFFYKAIVMDNQFNETIFTGSFLVPKIIYDTNINQFETSQSSILTKYYNKTITGNTVLDITLADAGTGEILFGTGSNGIQMKAFSGTTKITSLSTSGSNIDGDLTSELKWNGAFLLPDFVEKNSFLPDYAKSNGENLSDLEIPKIIKVGADTLGVGMNLDQDVEITIPGIPTGKNYGIISSKDGKNWQPVNTEVSLTGSGDLTFKTDHFSYFAPVVGNIVSCDLSLNSNENTAGGNVSFQFSSENATKVKLENGDGENIFISGKNGAKTITLSNTATGEIVYNFTVSNAISEKTCTQKLEILPIELDLGAGDTLSSTGEIVTFTGSFVEGGAETGITLKEVFEKFGENNSNLDKVKNFSATGNFLKFLNKKILNNSGKEIVGLKIGTGTNIFSPGIGVDNFKKEKISSISDKNFTEGGVKKIRKFKNPIKIGGEKTLVLDNYATLTFKDVGTLNSQFGFRKDGEEEWTFKNISNSSCEPVFPNECAYQSGNDVILKTYHFTEFVVIEDETVVDNCPNGDYTGSNNDGSCGTAPVISSGGGGGGGGGGGSFGPTVGNFTISATSKKDIETFDNLDLKRLKDGIIPVEIKMNHLSSKYSVLIEKGTQITTENGEIFTGKLEAPKRISNRKVPKINGATVALRALEIGNSEENLKFSKNIKVEFSTAGLSKKINRNNIFVYSWNEKLEKYFLETTNLEADVKNEKISFETNHATKFILTAGPIYLESGNIFNSEKNSVKNFSQGKTKFSDIKNHWAKFFIEELTEKNIFQNSENFRPNDNLTRAELSKILVEAFGLEEKIVLDEKNFSDIQKNSWYEKYFKILSSNEILNGYSDGTVKPGNFVNRAEAMKMILKVLEEKGELANLIPKRNYFIDLKDFSEKKYWFYNYVNKGKELGLISGYSDGTFGAGKNITRAEISKIIFNALGKF